QVDTEQRTDVAGSLDELTAKLTRLGTDTQVLIRADQAVDYGRVIAAMAALQCGGVSNVGLITEAPQS
ncbi:MAG: protein TolR, partial [Stenotrophomonas maltophilia]